MDGIYLGIVGVGGLLAGLGVYFGKKNLTQAGVLQNPTPFSRLEHNVGRCVALRGRPRTNDGAPFIYCKRTFQHYHTSHHRDSDGSHHDSSSWTTDSVREEGHPFHIEGDGGVTVYVNERPDEIYGKVSHTEGHDSFLTMSGATRVLVETLPLTPQLTVCGRLSKQGERWVLRRDPSLGLLVSPNDTASQATSEAIKGYLGVLGAPIAWLLVSLFSYRHFHPR